MAAQQLKGRVEVDQVNGLGVEAAHDVEVVARPQGAVLEIGLCHCRVTIVKRCASVKERMTGRCTGATRAVVLEDSGELFIVLLYAL